MTANKPPSLSANVCPFCGTPTQVVISQHLRQRGVPSPIRTIDAETGEPHACEPTIRPLTSGAFEPVRKTSSAASTRWKRHKPRKPLEGVTS